MTCISNIVVAQTGGSNLTLDTILTTLNVRPCLRASVTSVFILFFQLRLWSFKRTSHKEYFLPKFCIPFFVPATFSAHLSLVHRSINHVSCRHVKEFTLNVSQNSEYFLDFLARFTQLLNVFQSTL